MNLDKSFIEFVCTINSSDIIKFVASNIVKVNKNNNYLSTEMLKFRLLDGGYTVKDISMSNMKMEGKDNKIIIGMLHGSYKNFLILNKNIEVSVYYNKRDYCYIFDIPKNDDGSSNVLYTDGTSKLDRIVNNKKR